MAFGFIKKAGGFIGRIPVIGDIARAGVEAAKGTSERIAAASQFQAGLETQAQRRFQRQQAAAFVGGAGSQQIFGQQVPLLFIIGGGLLLLLLIRR